MARAKKQRVRVNKEVEDRLKIWYEDPVNSPVPKTLTVRVRKDDLMKLKRYEPCECEIGTLYYHIKDIGRFSVLDLMMLRTADYTSKLNLDAYIASFNKPESKLRIRWLII